MKQSIYGEQGNEYKTHTGGYGSTTRVTAGARQGD